MKGLTKTKAWTPPVSPELAFVALLLAGAAWIALPAQAEISPERKAELLYVLEQDCGSCHGLTMKGGLGSALLPENLEGKSARDIADVILNGIPGVPMPPWAPLMTDEEALFLADALKQGVLAK